LFRGLLTSFVGHALLLAWALLSLHRAPDFPETPTIEATIITPSEFTRLKQGSPESKELEAKAKDEPKPEVSKKEAEKPKPVTEPPPAAAPPPEPEKTQAAKPQEDAISEKLAALPPPQPTPEPGPTLEEKKKLEEKLEAERKADEKKKAEAKKNAEEKKKAEERKKAEEKRKKLAEEKRKADEAKKKKFDPDRIAALIDKSPDKRGAPQTATPPTKPTTYTGPTAGEREGHDTVLSAREQDLLKAQISGQLKRCWHLPGGGGGIETTVVTLKWRLKPDGSLDGLPQVLEPQSGPVFQIAAEAAVRAVTSCAPFDLPPDKYAVWKTVTWNFDPREMM
jgi:colicin import membrane protein